jgi:hypothetical protein
MDIITILIAVLALIISGLTYWDTTFRFKLDTSIGKQAKLYVCSLDNASMQPCIFMNIALINSGGKTEYIDDVKLIVKLSTNGTIGFEQEFKPIREFSNIFVDNSEQLEILPIVIIGRTSIIKKYVLTPVSNISQSQIANSFDLEITLYTKQRGKWFKQKVYKRENIINVWQDFNSNSTYQSLIIELTEKV